MLKLALLIASAAAFQPRSTKVQPKTVQNFGMLDGLFKKSEADVTEKVYFDISIGGAAPQRVELGLYGDTRCTNHFAARLRPRLILMTCAPSTRRLLDGEARDPTG